MIVSWLSFGCFALAALLHIAFFVYEWFFLKGSDEVKLWAKNIAVYNLCLAIGTIVGLKLVLDMQIMLAGYIITLFGLFMIAASITLAITSKRLRRFAFVQGGPPLLGFIFLAIHVLQRTGQI